MVDMSKFIAARSDQLNADDLLDTPRTITITKVTASPDAAEQPVSVHYDGDSGKPFKPCKTVRRIMVGVWGKDASQYVGRSMTLYRDPTVAFGGMQVGGIRVSHMSHIDEKQTVALMVTRGRKAPYTIKPLEAVRPAAAQTGQADDPASKWANGYVAKLATFTTAAQVDEFATEKAGKLAELQTARPELYSQVRAASAERRQALEPQVVQGGSFDDDLTEGASEPTAAEVSVAQYIIRADAVSDQETLNELIAEVEPHKPFLPDDLAVKLEVAFDKARQRLNAPAGALV